MPLTQELLLLRLPVRPPEMDICFCLPCILSPSGTCVPSQELPSSVDIGLTVSLDALLSPSPRGGHKTPSQTKQTSKSGNGGWRPFLPAPLISLGILFSCLLYGWSLQFFLRVCDPLHVPSVHFFLLALDHMGSVAYSKITGTDTSSLKLLWCLTYSWSLPPPFILEPSICL